MSGVVEVVFFSKETINIYVNFPSDYVLVQWFFSFFKRNPKSGLNQKLATQALKNQHFLKHFS